MLASDEPMPPRNITCFAAVEIDVFIVRSSYANIRVCGGQRGCQSIKTRGALWVADRRREDQPLIGVVLTCDESVHSNHARNNDAVNVRRVA